MLPEGPNGGMKSISEALGAMLPAFSPVGVERRGLLDARDAFLAEAVYARSSIPPFSNSAMDGYAVQAEDLVGATASHPRRLPLAGESRAGGDPPAPLAPGSAMRIFTGAPMPPGADAVVIQEDTELRDDGVHVRVAPVTGAHVRERGSDLGTGEMMVGRGARLGPGELGLLAAQRVAAVTVYRRPRVAILSTGDELRDLGDPEEPGTIVNSNAYALAAAVREAGAIPEILPNVPDDLEVTVSRVREGLKADLLITTGGVSVGDYDFVKLAFERCGVSAEFWKVRIKPGKPLTFGKAGEVPVVGLPGNPVSALVTFEVFVRPGIRKMVGDPRPFRPVRTVRLTHDHRHSPKRPELARARIEAVQGELQAEMHRLQGSGSLPSMVGIDGLVLLEAGVEQFAAGTLLPAVLFGDGTGASVPPFDG